MYHTNNFQFTFHVSAYVWLVCTICTHHLSILPMGSDCMTAIYIYVYNSIYMQDGYLLLNLYYDDRSILIVSLVNTSYIHMYVCTYVKL